MFYKLIYARFTRLAERFNHPKKSLSKGKIKIIKIGIEFTQSKQQRYLNHADIFIYNFEQI